MNATDQPDTRPVRSRRLRFHPVDTWPEMRVTFLPLPWTWRVRPYWWRDVDMTPSWEFRWLFVRVEFMATKWGDNFINRTQR